MKGTVVGFFPGEPTSREGGFALVKESVWPPQTRKNNQREGVKEPCHKKKALHDLSIRTTPTMTLEGFLATRFMDPPRWRITSVKERVREESYVFRESRRRTEVGVFAFFVFLGGPPSREEM